MKYDKLNNETKSYINVAIEIYNVIAKKKILKTINGSSNDKVLYLFTDVDKKILSLFIAGIINKGNVQKIFSKYEDIKLQDLLDFIDTDLKEITPLEEVQYSKLYDEEFYTLIKFFIKESYKLYDLKCITPELIISSLQLSGDKNYNILLYYSYNYWEFKDTLSFYDHPFFSFLEDYIFDNGLAYSERINEEKQENKKPEILLKDNFEFEIEENEDFIIDNKTWKILEEIKKKFVCQEEVVEGLFYNIINNQELINTPELLKDNRAIIFLDGPTGTGKTAITKEIAEKLNIPFVATSIVNYSSAGYSGNDLDDILGNLYTKCEGDLSLAERGIVILDEFDKIAQIKSTDLIMKTAVQFQLLDFLGGGKYNVTVGKGIMANKIEFDTSKLTFVCLGALNNLRNNKVKKENYIGFNQNIENKLINEYSISPQDLIDNGLEKELVGRLNTFLHTEEYDKEKLYKVLTSSSISPLKSFKRWIEMKGKKLLIEDGALELIVDEAYNLNTGARSLQTIINNIRTYYLKEVLRGKNKEIYLTCDIINKINRDFQIRRVRG